MATRTVSFRLCPEIIAAIAYRAKSLGKSKTEVVVEALTTHLRMEELGGKKGRLDSLEAHILELEQRIEQLENPIAQKNGGLTTREVGPPES